MFCQNINVISAFFFVMVVCVWKMFFFEIKREYQLFFSSIFEFLTGWKYGFFSLFFSFFQILIFEKLSCNFFSQWMGTLRKYLRKQTLNWFDLVNNFRIMACWNTPWLFFFSCHYHKILCIRFGDFGLKFFIYKKK